MNNFKEIFSSILGFLAVIVFLIEVYAHVSWNKQYFKFGIPIFVRKISLSRTNLLPSQFQEVNTLSQEFYWGPSIKFKEFGQYEYAFHDSLSITRFFRFSYLPAMRGYLRYDDEKEQIVVTGFLIYTYPIVILGLGFYIDPIISYFLFVMLFGTSYLFQAVRFNSVAVKVKELITAQ